MKLRNLVFLAVAVSILFTAVPSNADLDPDTLYVGINGQPVRLLAFLSVGRLNEIVNTMMYESLTTHNEQDELVCLLAESYKALDGNTWEFKLKKGIKFSNGDPMTADDVKFTFDKILDENTKSPFKTFLSSIKEVRAIDPETVHFITYTTDVLLPIRISDIYGSIVSKKHYEKVGPDNYDKEPIGTGPYVMKEWVKDSHITFEENPNYWGKKPGYKKQILKFIPDNAARIAALQAGELNLISNVPPAQVDALKAEKGIVILSAPGTRAHYLVTDVNKAPFNDIRVRQAVFHAIDRDALIKAILKGYGVPVYSVFIPQTFGYVDSIKPEYNPEKAKALLKEAGYENGLEIEFDSFTGGITDHSKIAEAVLGMLEEVGIKAKLNIEEQGVFGPRRLKNDTAVLYNYSFGDAFFDHGPNFRTFTGGAQGYYYANDAELTAKIDAALAEFDPEKRKEKYNEIVKDFYDKQVLIGLCRQDQIWAADETVNYKPQSDEMFRFFTATPKK